MNARRSELRASAGSSGAPGSRERRIFIVCCCAVISLLALVNAFVALEPGAARSDDVFAAFVPVAAAVLAAVAYHRLRAGARACVALVLGIPSLVSAGVAVSALRLGGPWAAGITGVLLLPVGIALPILGVRALWVPRKRGGAAWWCATRRELLVVAGLFALYWVVVPISLAIVATENPRDAVQAVDLGRPHEGVALRTSDGIRLNAWYVPSRNGASIVFFPRARTAAQARMLVRHGYGALLVDMRGTATAAVTPTPTAGVRPAMWTPPCPTCRRGPMSRAGASMGWARRWAVSR